MSGRDLMNTLINLEVSCEIHGCFSSAWTLCQDQCGDISICISIEAYLTPIFCPGTTQKPQEIWVSKLGKPPGVPSNSLIVFNRKRRGFQGSLWDIAESLISEHLTRFRWVPNFAYNWLDWQISSNFQILQPNHMISLECMLLTPCNQKAHRLGPIQRPGPRSSPGDGAGGLRRADLWACLRGRD